MSSYCTIDDLKKRSPVMQYSLDDLDIDDLISTASSHVEFLCDKADDYFTGNVPTEVKHATIYFAIYLFNASATAGLNNIRNADYYKTIELPETVKKRLELLLGKYMGEQYT